MKSIFSRQQFPTYVTAGLLVLLSMLGLNTSLLAQSGSYGNTFIPGNAETAVFGAHSFQNGGSGTLPGIVFTTRTSPQGYFSFAAGSSATGAADNAHVNGYVRKYGATAFTFPIGNGTVYRPLITPTQSASTVIGAAYFSTNPSSATLPAGAPFPTANLGTGVSGVSPTEYWDLDGILATTVTLTWNAASNLNTLTGGSASRLIIVGYNFSTSKWENLGQASLTGTVSTTGSITSTVSFVPNTYSTLTFGTIAMITANPDSGTASSGTGGTAIADVTANDLVNGVAATPTNSTLSIVSTSPGITLNTATGSVSVAVGTAPGTYTLTYQLCDKLTPPNCAAGLATVTVLPSIIANPDAGSASAGTGGTAVADVRANDLVNGAMATSANSSLSLISSASSGITLNTTTGSISVAQGTAPGTYTLVYSLCSTIGTTTCTTSYATVTVPGPDLIVAVGQPSPNLVLGQTSSIPVSVSNIGAVSTGGLVSFTLSIPASVTAPAAFSSNGFSCVTSGTLVSCSSPATIANGASTTVLVPITPLLVSAGTSPILSATVTTVGESNYGNNTATTTVTTPVAAPDLTISIGQPSPVLIIGQTSTVPIIINNGGTSPTSGPVTFTLSMPSSINSPASFTSNGFTCSTSGTLVACSSSATIVNGSNVTVSVPVTPNALAVSPVLSATVATANESNPNNNMATTTVSSVVAPDLTVSIGQPSPTLVAGQTSSVPVTINNMGTSPTTTPVTFTLSIPSSVTVPASFSSNGFTCSTSGTLVSCSSSVTITNGASTSLAIPITPLNAAVGTSPVLSGTVATANESNVNNNTATVTATPVAGQPDLVVSIGQPSPTLSVGQTSSVPVSLSNVGTAPTSGPVSFTLSIPSSVTASATFTSNGFSCATSGTLVSCSSSATIANGASTTVLVPITPLVAAAGTNPVLSVTAATGNESNPNNNTTTTTVTPAVAAPDLTTSIGMPAPALLAGQSSMIPLTVSNFGTFSTTGPVTATLVIPANFTAPASFTDNGFSCTTTGSVVACSSTGVIPNGSSLLINIPVTPGITAVGSQTFTATAATPNESNTANNGSTRVENPLAPTVSITSPANVTTTLTTAISGTATPNSTVVLTGPVGTTLCTTTVSATGSYSCLVTLPAGPIMVTAVATNIGGSSNPATTSFTAVAPASVTVTSPINVTTTLVPTVSGSATPGSMVTITGPGPVTLCTTTASASGTFACPVSVPAGPNTLTVTASGPGGSTSQPITFTAVAPPTVSITSPRNTTTTSTPTISGTATPGSTIVIMGPGPVTLCTTTASASGTYACSVSLTATGLQTITAIATNAAGVSIPATTSFNVSIFAIRVKMLLQGALIGTTAGAGIMRDDVRKANLIPLTEPYSGASFASSFTHVGGGGRETTTSGVLSVSSATDAIVDWVFVELRDPTNPIQVLFTRSALVQRDGDVVEVDGVTPLSFTASSGAYYVAVRHRNHLGAMTANPILLNGVVKVVDFTDPSLATYGTYARQVGSGKAALWAGNSNYATLIAPHQMVAYQGSSNDVSKVLLDVLSDSGNTGGPGGTPLATYIAPRYTTSDLDMDGQAIYQGGSNDIRVIFATVLQHPANTGGPGGTPRITYIVSEQLP